jgi:hypothetical protein
LSPYCLEWSPQLTFDPKFLMILSAPLRAAHRTNAHTGRADRPRNLLSLILRRMRQRAFVVDVAAAELTFLKSVGLAHRRLDPVASHRRQRSHRGRRAPQGHPQARHTGPRPPEAQTTGISTARPSAYSTTVSSPGAMRRPQNSRNSSGLVSSTFAMRRSDEQPPAFMLLGEGLAARSAGFGLDRVN